METKNILILGVVAVGGYYLYKTFMKPVSDLIGGGKEAVNMVTTPGADIIFGKGTTDTIMQPGYKTVENWLSGLKLPAMPKVSLPSVQDTQKTLLTTPIDVISGVATILGLTGVKKTVTGYAAQGTPATPKITTPQTKTKLAPFVSVVAPATSHGYPAQIPSKALSNKLRSLA